MKYNSFYYGLSLLHTLYNIDMEEDEYAEIALNAYDLIGNKRVHLKRMVVNVDRCDKYVELPCNIDSIEAVTLGNVEEWAYSTHDTPNGDYDSLVTEWYIEARKSFRHPMYIPGKFIKYEIRDNKMYFDRPHGTVFILYKEEVLDDNELPMITDREARAIATYCAWVYMLREAFKTRNGDTLKFALSLLSQWLLQCDQARIRPMSQNEMDQVLDARASSARKQYGRSLKVFQ